MRNSRPNVQIIDSKATGRFEFFTQRFLSEFASAAILPLTFALLCVLPACSIDVDKQGNKDGDKQVDIKSPLGDLHVSEQADMRDAGLTVYPGAKPAPKESKDDEKGANVNLSVPGFSMKVVAAEFISDDAPEKVTAYYNKELTKFGKPIQCNSGWHGGVHAEEKDDMSRPVSCDKTDTGEAVELKVGTEGNQHVVSVKQNGKGTRFALVYLRMHTGKDTSI
jgi:hypothetical protein